LFFRAFHDGLAMGKKHSFKQWISRFNIPLWFLKQELESKFSIRHDVSMLSRYLNGLRSMPSATEKALLIILEDVTGKVILDEEGSLVAVKIDISEDEYEKIQQKIRKRKSVKGKHIDQSLSEKLDLIFSEIKDLKSRVDKLVKEIKKH